MNTLSGPTPLVRQKFGHDDINWLWENRRSRRLRQIIINYFYSPTIPAIVSRTLRKRYKVEMLKMRRSIVKIRNLRRERRNLLTAEALYDSVYVSSVVDIIYDYSY